MGFLRDMQMPFKQVSLSP